MSLHTYGKVVVCFLVLCGLGLGNLPAPIAARPASALPVLSSAVANAVAPGTIAVDGRQFTPGGLVYIALYDEWGTTLRQERWTTASPTVYGVYGSQDPARGFAAGGQVEASFPQDRQTIYGPNGSQDPAQGYMAGDEQPTPWSLACDGPLVVRALDHRSATWSNLLDVEPGC